MTAPPAGSSPQAPFPPQDIASFLAFCAGEWLALRSCFELESGESMPAPDALAAISAASANSAADSQGREPDASALPSDGDGWHSSERAELLVAYLEPASSAEAGGLRLLPPGGGAVRELHFSHDGAFRSQAVPDPRALEGRVAGGHEPVGPAAAGGVSSGGVAPASLAVGGAVAQPDGGRWQLWPDGSLELTVRGPSAIVRERIWFTKPNLRLRSSVEQRPDGSPGRASFSSEIRRVSRSGASAQTASTQPAGGGPSSP